MADGAEHTGRPLLRSDTAATLDGEGRMPAVPLGAVLGKVEKEEDAWRTRTEAKATAPGAQDIVLESALDDPGAAEQRGGEAGDKPRPGRPAPKEPTELQRRIKALGAEIEEAERRAAQAAIAEAKKKQQEEERDSASRGGLGGLQGSLEELGTEARVLQRMAQEQQQREDAARRRGGGSRKTQRHLRADRDRTEVEKTENIVKGHHVVERLEAFSKVLTAETDEEIAKRKRLVMSSGNRALVDEHDDSWRHVRAKSATLPLWLISRDDFCELTRDTPENLTRFVRQALLGPEGRRTTTETAALVKWLRRYRHFSSMSNEQLAIVSRYLRFIHLEPGDSLEPEGAVVYYLLAGKAKLTKPNGDESPAGPGQAFGARYWLEMLGTELNGRARRAGRRLSAALDVISQVGGGSAAQGLVSRLAGKRKPKVSRGAAPRRSSMTQRAAASQAGASRPRASSVVEDTQSCVCTALLPEEGGTYGGVDLVELTLTGCAEALQEQRSDEVRSTVNFLNTIESIKGWTRSRIMLLAEALELREIPKGDFVFHEGDPVDTLVLLKSGRVRMIKEVELKSEERWPKSMTSWEENTYTKSVKSNVRELDAPAWLGEEAILYASRRARRAAAAAAREAKQAGAAKAQTPALLAAMTGRKPGAGKFSNSTAAMKRTDSTRSISAFELKKRSANEVSYAEKLKSKKRQHGVYALTDCEVLFLRADDFDLILTSNLLPSLRDAAKQHIKHDMLASLEQRRRRARVEQQRMLRETVGPRYRRKISRVAGSATEKRPYRFGPVVPDSDVDPTVANLKASGEGALEAVLAGDETWASLGKERPPADRPPFFSAKKKKALSTINRKKSRPGTAGSGEITDEKVRKRLGLGPLTTEVGPWQRVPKTLGQQQIEAARLRRAATAAGRIGEPAGMLHPTIDPGAADLSKTTTGAGTWDWYESDDDEPGGAQMHHSASEPAFSRKRTTATAQQPQTIAEEATSQEQYRERVDPELLPLAALHQLWSHRLDDSETRLCLPYPRDSDYDWIIARGTEVAARRGDIPPVRSETPRTLSRRLAVRWRPATDPEKQKAKPADSITSPLLQPRATTPSGARLKSAPSAGTMFTATPIGRRTPQLR